MQAVFLLLKDHLSLWSQLLYRLSSSVTLCSPLSSHPWFLFFNSPVFRARLLCFWFLTVPVLFIPLDFTLYITSENLLSPYYEILVSHTIIFHHNILLASLSARVLFTWYLFVLFSRLAAPLRQNYFSFSLLLSLATTNMVLGPW